ncbi:hypothetical protein ACA910_006207 [Epithemia clementina (nom. ined.)]
MAPGATSRAAPSSSFGAADLFEHPDKTKNDYNDFLLQQQPELDLYLHLIEQSLQVHMLDNALWIAERCAADFPSSPEAVYQLALCHYRCGNFKASRYALEQRIYCTSKTTSSTESLEDDDDHDHPMDYLESLCCYELKDYSRAEECLLHKARAKYKEQHQLQQNGNNNNNNNGKSTAAVSQSAPALFASLDDWIFQNLDDNSQGMSLIPMGAAGFCLLGKIFLRSNRKQRAIPFFRASLRLDPFLWTSMEALAELGAYSTVPDTSSNPANAILSTKSTKLAARSTGGGAEYLEEDNAHDKNGADENCENGQSVDDDEDNLPPFQLSRKSMDGTSTNNSRRGTAGFGPAEAGTRLFGSTPVVSSTPILTGASSSMIMAEDEHGEGGDISAPLFPSTIPRNTTNATRNHTSILMQTPGLTPIAPSTISRVHMSAAPHLQNPLETPFPAAPLSTTSAASGGGGDHDDGGGDWSITNRSTLLGGATTASSFSFLAPRQTHMSTNTTTMGLSAIHYQGQDDGEQDELGGDSNDADESDETSNVRRMHLASPEIPHPTTPGRTSTAAPPQTSTKTGLHSSRIQHHENGATDSVVDVNDMFPSSAAWNDPLMRELKTTTAGSEHVRFDQAVESGVYKVAQRKKRKQTMFAASVFAPPATNATDPSTTSTAVSPAAVQSILRLIQTAATFYQHVCQYRCKEALQTLQTFSKRQQDTGWVLHQQGRAHLELNEFTASQRCLELMQAKDPCRLSGLELLSTVYWHLKKEVELSHLSQRVLAANRLSAVTWCVVGNCFSLQKDHETALVFFRRSLQIDPNFTYIHTLCGYEYMANEDFDKAIVCFRQALRVNERHYNAWYGLGAIFHRQEKFDLAEYHFERAMQLHPTSSILLCNLGIAQYANGKAYQALDTLAQAFRLDPQNPQARFQRASIYAALHRPSEALAELLKVRDSAPREAAVHFAMGKVLKRLGRPQEAISAFLTAMDLDPKDNQIIKSAMDKVGEPDVSEESMSTF